MKFREKLPWLAVFCAAGLLLFLMQGCDTVGRQKLLIKVLDGYPDLVPPEELCVEYEKEKAAALLKEKNDDEAEAVEDQVIVSMHRPFEEKRCNDCHDTSTRTGLVSPKQELCLICHEGFLQGEYQHGPVAVRDCLACHLPHNSAFDPLLKRDKVKLCNLCHREARLASGMHEEVGRHQMICVDCHDPHFGYNRYFLK